MRPWETLTETPLTPQTYNTMYPASYSYSPRLSSEDVPNVIDELDEEDGYDRFSKKTKYEAKADYNAYAGVEKNEEDQDLEDFYDGLYDGNDHSVD